MCNNIDLSAYGLNGRFAALAAEYPGLTAARIVAQEKGRYDLLSAWGEAPGAVSGRFRHAVQTVSKFPAVGDFVMTDWNPDGEAVIRHVLPRKSCLLRRAAGGTRQEQVVAANVDTVFLCMALDQDFNLRRLERYLALTWKSGASPVVVLTKADLCGNPAGRAAEASAAALGADVLVTCAREPDGWKQLLPWLGAGQTTAFLGSSGVGKSTLINCLLGEARQAAGDVRGDGRGRHTTTRRALFRLPAGGLVIDTPGMRDLGLWDAGDGLDRTFSDVEALAARCRFRDCTHTGEPGCAVAYALETGSLAAERWKSYQKLRAEQDFAADSAGWLAAKERKFKEIARINKANRSRPSGK